MRHDRKNENVPNASYTDGIFEKIEKQHNRDTTCKLKSACCNILLAFKP
jgi:hypothetical protein